MFSHIDPLADEDTAVDMSDSSTIRSAIGFFEDLFRGCDTPNLAVRFWDGSVWRLRSDQRDRRNPGSPASGIAQPDASLARPAGHRRSLYL